MPLNLKSIALMLCSAFFIAVLGQLSIPLPLVPITGQTLAVGLVATALGGYLGLGSIFIYLLAGALGLPVFAKMASGLDVLVGPTGGYLFSFIPAVIFIGIFLKKTAYTWQKAFIANLLATLIILICGMFWLHFSTSLSLSQAFMKGLVPFLLGGLLKSLLAGLLGVRLRKLLV